MVKLYYLLHYQTHYLKFCVVEKMHPHKIFGIKMTSLVVVIVQSILNLLFMTINTLNNFYTTLKCQSQKWARVYLTYFKGNEKFFVTNCTSNNQNKLNFLFPILSCGKHKKLRHGSTLTIYWRNTVLHCPVLI